MSAVYRRGVEAEILADNQPHSVQLPNRYPRQMARKPLSVRPALSVWPTGDLGRRIRRSVHSLGLDEPRRFDLQWHRHTGTWFCLHRGLSLVEALKTIEADGLLHPP